MAVRLEREEAAPLAAIFFGRKLAFALRHALEKRGLRLRLLSGTESLPVWEKPAYIFFFKGLGGTDSQEKETVKEIKLLRQKWAARLVVISGETAEGGESPFPPGREVRLVKIRGEAEESSQWLAEAAEKLVQAALGPAEERLLILGKQKEAGLWEKFSPDFREETRSFRPTEKRKPALLKIFFPAMSVLAAITLLFSPLLIVAAPAVAALAELNTARQQFFQGEFSETAAAAQRAEEKLILAREGWRRLSGWWPDSGWGNLANIIDETLGTGETGAEILRRAARLGPMAAGFLAQTAGQETNREEPVTAAILRSEIGALNEELGILSGRLEKISSDRLVRFLGLAGFPEKKSREALAKIPTLRQAIAKTQQLLGAWEEIFPAQKRVYLVVFQNSAELRPTGGFIGSYGLVRLEEGKLWDWEILDIYSADGQLRSRVAPPDEILHFLGQPNWYMRDANFAADWPLTAERLLWFLEKETNVKADGVIGVNLGAVQKLLAATGPLTIATSQETISAEDFFAKTETISEINFFAGSTQKKDFLGAAAQALLDNLAENIKPETAQAMFRALEEKDILLYFRASQAEAAVQEAGWGGSLDPENCRGKNFNCLALVEANFGANKANFYLERQLQITTLLGKEGEIDNTAVIRLRNGSPSEAWPGGRYKAYLRFLVPAGSQLVDFDLGNGRRAAISQTLTETTLKGIGPDQVLVYQSPELSLRRPTVAEVGWTSFGALLELPVGQSQTVTFRYRPPARVKIQEKEPAYSLTVLKQPGTGPDAIDFILEYPSFLTPRSAPKAASGFPLAFPQRLIYNTQLSTDRTFFVPFKKTW